MNILKSTKPYIYSAITAILIAGFCACSQNGLTDDNINPSSQLAVQVVDKGYEPSPNNKTKKNLQTTDNKYQTTFTAGDQIGVYILDKNGSFIGKNIQLIATKGTGDALVWKTAEGKDLLFAGNGTYYAYYPYQATLKPEQEPDQSAASAEEFFTKLIKIWQPAKDQSTHDNYAASDLMVGSGTVIDGTSIKFQMNHALVLWMMNFSASTTYIFTNAMKIPNYTINKSLPPVFDDKDIKPFLEDSVNETLRYLVNPRNIQSGQIEISGNYGANIQAKWLCSIDDDPIGTYHNVYIDQGKTIKIPYQLNIGDFFLKNGQLLHYEPKQHPLSDTEKKMVIGVVIKDGLDKSVDDDTYKMKDGQTEMKEVHGYVVSTKFGHNKDANDLAWSFKDPPFNSTYVGTNAKKGGGDWHSYSNTVAIKNFSKNKGGDLQTNFPACYYATDGYEKDFCHAPETTSGWLFPAIGLMNDQFDHSLVDRFIGPSLSYVGGDPILSSEGGFPQIDSSTEVWNDSPTSVTTFYYLKVKGSINSIETLGKAQVIRGVSRSILVF